MRKAILICLVAAAAVAAAQTAVAPFRTPRVTFVDANGLPLVGGCIFTYLGGTSTPQATYTDHNGGTPNPNPVILDSTASAVIWLAAPSYKYVAFSAGGVNCASGALQWTVDQVPGDSFLNGTITGAAIVGGTMTGTAISGGSVNNTPIGATLPGTGLFTTLNGGITNGVLNPGLCGASPAPAWCAGSDMGAWINAAFVACSNGCTVQVPPGTYNYSTTISEPPTGSASLVCEGGVFLGYTGSGDAFDYFGPGGSLGPTLAGCAIQGTSSAAAGIHVKNIIGALISGVSVTGFTNGDCIEDEGASTVLYVNISESGCKNGVHNVGLAGISPAANIHFIGGELGGSQYGAYEEGTLSGSVGFNSKDSYEGVYFLFSGTQAFFQGCSACELRNNTFQLTASATNQLLLGDSSFPATASVIADNYFIEVIGTLTNDINLANAAGTVISGNLDSSVPAATNFVNNGASSAGTFVLPNTISSATTTYTTGTGTYVEICRNVVGGTPVPSCNFPVLQATSMQAVGTTPIVSGCGTISAQTGGGLSGTFVTAGTSCTPALTNLPATTNGYSCLLWDRTNYVAPLGNLTSTATSATFANFATTAGDVLAFQCGLSN